MLTRLCLTLINIFFPPLSVLLLTGPYTDTLINCLLFIAGVMYVVSGVPGFLCRTDNTLSNQQYVLTAKL